MLRPFEKKSIGRKIHVLFRLSMSHVRLEMEKLGIDAGGFGFLGTLFLQDGLSQDELSNKLRVNKSYTARALVKLEKKGLIKRCQDPKEHRIKRVYLAEKAFEIEPQFVEILKSWHDVMTQGIADDQLKIVRESLEQMIFNAESFLGLPKDKNKENKKP